MKLFSELLEDVQYITETREDGKKNMYITGPFLQCEVKNRNGRLYEKQIMSREVERYSKDLVESGRAYGELGHPSGPQINLERVSHRIISLKEDGNNYIGKAMLIDTPYGNIAKGIIESGGRLGVSSRGLGSLEERNGTKYVKDDFMLATAADIVADPSAPDAFVNGIMEGVEWIWDNGSLRAEEVAAQTRKKIDESVKKKGITEEMKFKAFQYYLEKLSKS
jgi:hypothetical protein